MSGKGRAGHRAACPWTAMGALATVVWSSGCGRWRNGRRAGFQVPVSFRDVGFKSFSPTYQETSRDRHRRRNGRHGRLGMAKRTPTASPGQTPGIDVTHRRRCPVQPSVGRSRVGRLGSLATARTRPAACCAIPVITPAAGRTA